MSQYPTSSYNPYFYYVASQNSAYPNPIANQFYGFQQYPYLRNDNNMKFYLPENIKNTYTTPERERRIQSLFNGQGMPPLLGNIKQKNASYDDQLCKTKKANKDVIKKQGLEPKKASQNGVIVIDDDENDQVAQNKKMQQINMENDSSSVEVIEKPQNEEHKQKIQDKSNNQQHQQAQKQNSERAYGTQAAGSTNIMQKIISINQSDKSDTVLISNISNTSKGATQATSQNSSQLSEKKTANIPQKQLIILSDEEDEGQDFILSQPKELYCYQNNSKSCSSSSINSVKNMGQCTQYQKMFQTSQKNIKQIPVCDFAEDLTILKVQNPHKLHINDQFRATQIKRSPFDINSLNSNSFTSKLEKVGLKEHLRLTKLDQRYAQNNSNSSKNSYQNVQKSNKLNDFRGQVQNFSQVLHNQNSNNSVSSSSSKAAHTSQNYKNNQNQKYYDSVQSPSNTNSSQQEEKNKKFINSKYLYCRKCDKQIEFSNIRKTSEGQQQLCKACYQTKQKNDQQDKRYWEQVFRNTEDRQNKTEVGIEYQAIVPQYSMVNIQQWQQQNKSKFQAILTNKVHSAEDNGIYTEVINLIRQKYNENYSHNDFLSLIKNTKMSLNQIKDKMENDDQDFMNQIEACCSNTCKNQRVTRLTKRRLEYLQNY
ncbi:hypothetical protein ABPG72_010151 [Tetrahymena utriculariae]